MKVIVFSGKAGHGKDTTASFMKEVLDKRGERVLITHYGDLVKYVCKTFFDWDGKKDKYGRTLLQFVGTDVVRERDPDFWVRFLSGILTCFSDYWDYVLIPDARFKNEVNAMKYAGFDTVHVRVHNPCITSSLSEEQQNHPSETALDDVRPDLFVFNRGTLEDLKKTVETSVQLIDKLFEEITV